MNDSHLLKSHPVDAGYIEMIRKGLPGHDRLQALAELFSILGDGTRLQIVLILQDHELCVHEISEIISMSLSAVSHQLRLLKAMRLVKFRKQGKMVYYSLNDDHISKLLHTAFEHITE